MAAHYDYSTKLPPVAKDIVNKWWLKSKDGKFLSDTKIHPDREQELQRNMFNCSLELLNVYWRSMSFETKKRAKWTRANIEKQLGEMM